MFSLKRFFFIFILFCSISLAVGKKYDFTSILNNITEKQIKLLKDEYKGTEFFFNPIITFEDEIGSQQLVRLFFVTDKTTNVKIEVPANKYLRNIIVKPYLVSEFAMSSHYSFPYYKTGREQEIPDSLYPNYGVHITSDNKIFVYCKVDAHWSSDGFLVLPKEKLGKEYVCTAYGVDPMFEEKWKYILPTLCCITATEDSTILLFTLGGEKEQVSAGGLKSGDTRKIQLNKNDLYIVSSKGKKGELAGSLISANKPIAVVSGNMCTNVPTGNQWCDMTVEMEQPIENWGKIFPVASIPNRKHPSVIRIFAKDSNTIVFKNGIPVGTIIAKPGEIGKSFLETRITEFEDSTNQIAVYSSNKPVSVTLYNTGAEEDSLKQFSYDPFSMAILPVEDYLRDIIVSNPKSKSNYLQLIYPVDSSGEVSDNMLVGILKKNKLFWEKIKDVFVFEEKTFPSEINNQKYSVSNVLMPNDSFFRIKSDQPFISYSFGFNDYDSYGFPSSVDNCGLNDNYVCQDTLGPEIIQDSSCYSHISCRIIDLPENHSIRGGIKKLIVDTSSYNFYWVGENEYVRPSDTVNTTFWVINKFLKGYMKLIAIDSYGNSSSKEFFYNPELFISETLFNDTVPVDVRKVEHSFTITNKNYKPIKLWMRLGYNYSINREFIEIDTAMFPVLLNTRDSVKIKFALKNINYEIMKNSISIYDSCSQNIIFNIPVSLYSTIPKDSLSNLTITPDFLDFGRVTRGTYSTGQMILIKNNSSNFRTLINYSLMKKDGTFGYTGSNTLASNMIIGIRVYFKSDKPGIFNDTLQIEFLSGEKKYIPLFAESVITDVSENRKNENYDKIIITPNPVSQSTVISYSLEKPVNIRLSLFNQLGQEVALLEEGWKDTGEHNYQFSIVNSQLPDGMYFVRLRAGDKVWTEKIVVVK